MVAKFHSTAFSNFNKVLKAHLLHWSGAYCVYVLCVHNLLSAPFSEINKIAPAQGENSEMSSLANVWDIPTRALSF